MARIEFDVNSENLSLAVAKEVLHRRKSMVEEATVLADFLLDWGEKVKRVGVAGSLSRGKRRPGDIDLVVFIDNDEAKKCQNNRNELMKKGEGDSQVYEYLGMDYGKWNVFVFLHDMFRECRKYPVDVIVASDCPDEEYLKLAKEGNVSPKFLENILNDVVLYDPEMEGFRKENVFTEEQMKLVKQMSLF